MADSARNTRLRRDREKLLYGDDAEAWENSDDKAYLEFEKEYYEKKEKDPNFPFAVCTRVSKPRKSLFAQTRSATTTKSAGTEESKPTILLGNIIEKRFDAPKMCYDDSATTTLAEEPKSLFAKSYQANITNSKPDGESDPKVLRLEDATSVTSGSQPQAHGEAVDSKAVKIKQKMCPNEKSTDEINIEVQQENDERLRSMTVDEKLKAREELLRSLDIKLLAAFKRKAELRKPHEVPLLYPAVKPMEQLLSANPVDEPMDQLPSGNPAAELLEQINIKQKMCPNEKSTDEIYKEVQEENDERLRSMTVDEKLKVRAELLSSLDIKMLTAFKRKAEQRKPQEVPLLYPTDKPMEQLPSANPVVEPMDQLPSGNPAAELLEQSREHNWVHFDIVEHDKLDWMREISLKAKKLKPDEKFEARFDLKGVLLPYTIADSEEEMAKAMQLNRELYFHADEPNRAGYTMQELFRLARSGVLQQRTAALGAIGGMLNIYNQGFYDRVFDIPLSKIFFLLRFAFDENTPAMVETVSKALAALFYNDTDEILLDYMFDNPSCAWQPMLTVGDEENKADEDATSVESMQKQLKTLNIGERKMPKEKNMIETTVEDEKSEDVDVNDFQLAETDLVKCALRTNILQRIWFILDRLRPNNSTVTSCLKLLIRFARSGAEAAKLIFNFDDLMGTLRKNFLPLPSNMDPQSLLYLHPQPLCIKLFRVVASYSTAQTDALRLNGVIGAALQHMHAVQNINAQDCKIQTEVMRLMRVALTIGRCKELDSKFVKQLYAMVPWHLNYKTYAAHTPLVQRMHATSLVALICCYNSQNDAELPGEVDVLYDLCCSTFHQAKQNGVTTMSQINLLNICLDAALMCVQRGQAKRMAPFINGQLKNFIESQHFLAMVEKLSSTSLILSPFFDRSQVHEALPNVGAILLHESGPALIMSEQYATHLLKTLFQLLDSCDALVASKAREALLRPAVTTAISHYIARVGRRINRRLTANFFAKRELHFLLQLLVGQSLKVPLEPQVVVQCAYNLASCLGPESVSQLIKLFCKVLFHPEYIQAAEVTLKKWADCFTSVVMPSMIYLREGELTLNLPYRSPGVLPPDWVFFYIKDILHGHLENIKYPSQQKSGATSGTEFEFIMMTYEYWRLLELASPQLRVCSPTEILMYLMITFMGRERCWLDPEVKEVLQKRVTDFFEEYKDYRFQFDDVFDGKCSFQNLYILFTNHFISESYCDHLFGALVMVPQAMRHDVKYRKMLWSELVPALDCICCPKEMLMGGFEAYIEPAETDMSLIRDYRTVIRNREVRKGSLPYEIAKHHVTLAQAALKKQLPIE